MDKIEAAEKWLEARQKEIVLHKGEFELRTTFGKRSITGRIHASGLAVYKFSALYDSECYYGITHITSGELLTRTKTLSNARAVIASALELAKKEKFSWHDPAKLIRPKFIKSIHKVMKKEGLSTSRAVRWWGREPTWFAMKMKLYRGSAK